MTISPPTCYADSSFVLLSLGSFGKKEESKGYVDNLMKAAKQQQLSSSAAGATTASPIEQIFQKYTHSSLIQFQTYYQVRFPLPFPFFRIFDVPLLYAYSPLIA